MFFIFSIFSRFYYFIIDSKKHLGKNKTIVKRFLYKIHKEMRFPMSEITIKDIAKHAGVSVATVSRVVNGFPGVSPATMDRVNKAIADLNYVPNATARSLKIDRTNLLAMLVSNISNSHFTSMAKTIESCCRQQHFNILLCNTEDDPDIELEYLKRLTELRVDGIILNTTGLNDAYVCSLSHTIPMVLVDRSIEDPDFAGDFVGSNGFDGMKLLTSHLIERGHRRIGIISSNQHVSTGRERYAGFVDAMKMAGITVDDRYPYKYAGKLFNEEDGISGARYLMSLKVPPTAIVAANNNMAIGVYKYLGSQNISVPDAVSVVSYGNISNSDLFPVIPTFTTLNPTFIGEKTATLLLSRIQDNTRSKREVIFEPLLLVNESTRSI